MASKQQKKPEPQKHKTIVSDKTQSLVWPLIVSLPILAYGLYRAIALRWICDDAFITMRYVKNFLDGHGIVYNIGERVEGYTHFLWLLLLSAAGAIGFDPVEASQWLGIVSFAGIVILLLLASYRAHKTSTSIWLPIAAALFTLNYDNQVWASGGLETSFYTLLIFCAFYVWFYSTLPEQKRLITVGVILALVSLTRPDGVLFTFTAVLLLGVRSRSNMPSAVKQIARILLPSIVIGLPYLVWKYFYYGDLLPLTYYAKSGGSSYYWAQGFYYIWLFFRVHYVLGLAMIASIAILLKQHNASERSTIDRGSPVLAAAMASVIYLVLFVAKSGGDFMFGRFLVPILPLIAFTIERAMQQLRITPKPKIAIALAHVASVFVENALREKVLFHINDRGALSSNWNLKGPGSTHGIADERWEYYYGHYVVDDVPRGVMDIYSGIGKYLEPFFRHVPVTVAIPGGKNMVAYYANFRTCINEFGLTDSAIAHSPATTGGRIGHEKQASLANLESRGVNFELNDALADLPDQLTEINIAFEIPESGVWQFATLIAYDSGTMSTLTQRFAGMNSLIPNYPMLIRHYADNELMGEPLATLQTTYARFVKYYFSRYPDPALENRFKARIAQLRSDSADSQRLRTK